MRGAKPRERPVEIGGPPRPQSPGGRQVVVGARTAFAGRHANGLELLRIPAGADAQDQAACGHYVQGRCLVGDVVKTQHLRVTRGAEHGASVMERLPRLKRDSEA